MLFHSDIGISTGAYAELPLEEALQRIAEIAPAAEVFSYRGHSLVKPGNAQAIAAVGLPFSVHGPFTHYEFATASNGRHHAALELHRRHMEVAAELGAFLYIVHPDLRPRPRAWNPKVAAALERSFEELRILQDELGLAVAIENMPLSRHSHFTRPGDLDLRGLGLVLDAGHAALTGTLAEWLSEPQASLRHVHLHDNLGRGDGDSHRPLGSGVVDAGPVLTVARTAGATIALELTNEADVLASLEYLRANELLPLARQID
ncbi:MAG TPA: sugar phosphate isomerase/epimerase [Thermoleophilia bacterium]|nr:sugar phosphate isomerase/epimerase [Thermoleophilia bacterium]